MCKRMLLFLILVVSINAVYAQTPVNSQVLVNISETFYIEDPSKIKEFSFYVAWDSNNFEVVTCVLCNYVWNGTHFILEPKLDRISSGNNAISLVLKVNSSLMLPYEAPTNNYYLFSTPAIPSNDSFVKELAKNITSSCNDFECEVVSLVEWINNYLTYDMAYGDKNYGFYEIYDQKKGVCAEYTTMFVTFMRALGYETRYVSSYAYANEWQPHAYAEVYYEGKWYPIDVLWKQIFYVDSNHIRLSSLKDNQYSNAVAVVYEGSNAFKWLNESFEFYLLDVSYEDLFVPLVHNITLETTNLSTYVFSQSSNIKGCVFYNLVSCKNTNLYFVPSSFYLCNNDSLNLSVLVLDNFSYFCSVGVYDTEGDVYFINLTYIYEPATGCCSWLYEVLYLLKRFLSYLLS